MAAVVVQAAVAGNGKITGVIKSADGEVVLGANVLVEGTQLGGAADAKGNYFILNVPPGTYRVRASGVGFVPEVVTNVRIGSDQIVTLNFTLKDQAVGLSEVVVEASRPPIDKSQTGARTRMAADDMSALPAADLSAIVATSASTYKGYIRGGRTFETKTMVDGIDVTDQYVAWVSDVPGGSTPYLTYNGVMRNNEAQNSSLVGLSKAGVEEANVLTGGVGSDYSSASAGIISYNLKEGRGKWTARVDARMSQTGGLKHYGPDVYWDDTTYFRIKNNLAASASQADRDKSARFTYTEDKYSYGAKPEMFVELSTGGAVTEDFGLYITGRYFDSYGRMPNEHTTKLNASLKANYNFTQEMKLNATFLMEDRGMMLGWKNTSYAEDFRYFLEGVPRWDGMNLVGSLKWTHVLSPGTFYEVQASMVSDESRRGYSDDNNDGVIGLDEDGEYLTWADTAQVNRYMANAGNAQFHKFFSPTPRNETGSENVIPMAGLANWKIARPGIYYEDFTNTVTTIKADITSQINANHQLRGGLQARMHDLDMTRRAGYIGGVFPTYKNYVDEVWNVKPNEYSAYIQDKMEYAGLIINLGLRLDGLDIAAADYANYFAPFLDTRDANGGQVRVPVRGEEADIKWLLSPRIGVSHPISDVAAMYFSFSQTQQSQPFSRLYTNYSDFGNPSLPVTVRANQDPIKSTNYDLGIQWSFYEGYGLDVNAYYKDIQSYGVNSFTVTPNAPYRLYIMGTEFGYADSRGIELTLNK
ncbi:TonB-dependent receptor, partial [Candidatus Uhrbacteria bacterium]|nr:TonB-dependent receptor [Candidatus Uhrbacteria bacterium]